MESEITSIIILGYKELEKFKKTVETIIQNTHKKETPYEIIVLLNNAEQGIIDYVTNNKNYFDKIIIEKENIGVSKGYNKAVKESTGKYLCFFNSDYYVQEMWLKSMIICFEHQPNIGICSCCTNVTGNIPEKTAIDSVLYDDYIESDCAIANMFTTKEIFKEVEGFDETYFVAFLDLDLNEKIKAKGYRVFVNRKTFAIHDYMSGKEATISKETNAGRNYFHRKWGAEVSDLYKWA